MEIIKLKADIFHCQNGLMKYVWAKFLVNMFGFVSNDLQLA